jgi:shikimate kinase
MKPIVFIGMPGCGKTTVSRRLAYLLKRPWFDSDLEIERQEGMSIAELFAVKGEAYFRVKETECIRRLLQIPGAIIAVGGGAVMGNADLIRENATVVYLHRSLARIRATLNTSTRPLLKDDNSLNELYQRRHHIYEEICDVTFDNDDSLHETIMKIKGWLT